MESVSLRLYLDAYPCHVMWCEHDFVNRVHPAADLEL